MAKLTQACKRISAHVETNMTSVKGDTKTLCFALHTTNKHPLLKAFFENFHIFQTTNSRII
jgi:hypothetical protein